MGKVRFEQVGVVRYRKEAIIIARQLLYGQDVIDRIKAAQKEFEICAILANCRKLTLQHYN